MWSSSEVNESLALVPSYLSMTIRASEILPEFVHGFMIYRYVISSIESSLAVRQRNSPNQSMTSLTPPPKITLIPASHNLVIFHCELIGIHK